VFELLKTFSNSPWIILFGILVAAILRHGTPMGRRHDPIENAIRDLGVKHLKDQIPLFVVSFIFGLILCLNIVRGNPAIAEEYTVLLNENLTPKTVEWLRGNISFIFGFACLVSSFKAKQGDWSDLVSLINPFAVFLLSISALQVALYLAIPLGELMFGTGQLGQIIKANLWMKSFNSGFVALIFLCIPKLYESLNNRRMLIGFGVFYMLLPFFWPAIENISKIWVR
jgi:hypothetical protein